MLMLELSLAFYPNPPTEKEGKQYENIYVKFIKIIVNLELYIKMMEMIKQYLEILVNLMFEQNN